MKPLEVTIIAPKRSFSAGVRSELVCRSSGSRPPAQITWWKNGSTRLMTSEPHASVRQTQSPDGNVSLSSLSFVASPEDDGSVISCRVHNPHIINEPLEEKITLSVHCKCDSESRASIPFSFSSILFLPVSTVCTNVSLTGNIYPIESRHLLLC